MFSTSWASCMVQAAKHGMRSTSVHAAKPVVVLPHGFPVDGTRLSRFCAGSSMNVEALFLTRVTLV